MRNLYGEGFSEQSRKQLAPVVMSNLLEGVVEIGTAVKSLNLTLGAGLEDDLKEIESIVLGSAGSSPRAFLTPELAQKVKRLIQDTSFQTALSKRSTFQLQDCWQSFADQLVKEYPTWGGETWVPSVSDCVSVRVRTSGIVEEQFIIDKIVFNVFDVGGQRAERRKWIHSFDNVTAVIFVTAISEYDQVLFEDRNKNRLEEALELFEEICNSRWFLKNPLMLFLNKKDLFEHKFLIEKVPLNISGKFPTAPDSNDDLKKAIDWITSQFLKKRKSPDKDIYTHVTTATDPHNVRAVFDVCRNVILKKSLANSGFVLDGKS
jgi:GTPase SAR1 family protein